MVVWIADRNSSHDRSKSPFFSLSSLLRELGSLCWDHSIRVVPSVPTLDATLLSSYTQAGFDPLLAEGAEFTEWKTDAFTNQATTAGLKKELVLQIYKSIFTSFNIFR